MRPSSSRRSPHSWSRPTRSSEPRPSAAGAPVRRISKMAAQDAYECDVLVIGSGASGMSAAVTAAAHGLKVLVIEKEPKFGGSTARSGGWLWIPNTSLAKVQGIYEPEGAARTYLAHEAGDSFDSERVDAFIKYGPEAVDFFTTKASVRFDMP